MLKLKIKIQFFSYVMMENIVKFYGIIPPIPTPFDLDGNVDFDAFKDEVRRYMNIGVNGIVIGGSTGEGHTLLDSEIKELLEIASELKKENFTLIAGIIVNSTYQALHRINQLKKLESIDAFMITPPHYIFNNGDEGIYWFYREIYEKTKVPIIIYNVIPWNMASPTVIEKLAKEGVIVGVKQSGGEIHILADILARTKGSIAVLSAIDDLLYPSFVLGAHGSIAAANTILPKTSLKLFRAVKDNDLSTARKIHEEILPIINAVIRQPDAPSRIKFVMNNAGWKVGYPRKPLMEPTGDLKTALLKIANEIKKLEEE